MIPSIRAHYEAYPYPARAAKDEARRLITGSPSHFDEVIHYVFAGQRDARRPLRVLVAGGGTGDGTIMLAQQAKEAGQPIAITYLDLSDAARRIAEARAEVRGLTGSIIFRQGSLLDMPETFGPFDYIDCCGVLHHLDDPQAGLKALVRVLAPRGGIGLMVYAPLGRAGVYPLQQALATLTDGMTEPAERLALARRLLKKLPPTHPFARNPFLSDHLASDAGLYDLLLHNCDRPFTVPTLLGLVTACGLTPAALIEPARYDPALWFNEPKLRSRMQALPMAERAALAEQLFGHHTKHIAYLLRPGDAARAVAQPDDADWIPVLKDVDGPAVAADLNTDTNLEADLDGLVLSLPLPRLAPAMLARIDGRRTLGEIHAMLQALDPRLDWEHFQSQFASFYAALNGVNKLLLRRAPGVAT